MRWSFLGLCVFVLLLVALGYASPPAPPAPPSPLDDCVITLEGVEACDGLDNDCDGAIDENLTMNTTCGQGLCAGNEGVQTCVLGSWVNDTCDPFDGALEESCRDDIDNDCDGLVDDEDPACDGGGGGGGSSHSSFYIPSGEADDEEEVLPRDEEEGPMVVPLNWSYKGSVASVSVPEPTSPLKRLSGTVPRLGFLDNSSLVSADGDELLAPLPEGFALFHRFRFEGDVEGVVFEELAVTFTVDRVWREEHPDGRIMVLYPFDGRWRVANASYNDGSRLYKASLVNVPLRTFVLGAGSLAESSVQPDPVPLVNGTAGVPPAPRQHTGFPFVLVLSLVVGSLLVLFFLLPSVPFLSGVHDEVRGWFGPGGAADPSGDVVDERRSQYSALLSRLDGYISRQRSLGVPENSIADALRRAGWRDEVFLPRLRR